MLKRFPVSELRRASSERQFLIASCLMFSRAKNPCEVRSAYLIYVSQ